MQVIIATGDYKEIAALAVEMQGRQGKTVRLHIDGEDALQPCPWQLISEAVARGVQNQPPHESKSTAG